VTYFQYAAGQSGSLPREPSIADQHDGPPPCGVCADTGGLGGGPCPLCGHDDEPEEDEE
jgi:hypothetical protein